uniref:Uncharacterized protein n=1 Tax=Anguilla anguilla TaxID=7936 RepID=A0A0E9UZ56_ANGAN
MAGFRQQEMFPPGGQISWARMRRAMADYFFMPVDGNWQNNSSISTALHSI